MMKGELRYMTVCIAARFNCDKLQGPHLKSGINLNNIYKLSTYLTENICAHYKYKPGNAAQ
jgi:hypothetical protein